MLTLNKSANMWTQTETKWKHITMHSWSPYIQECNATYIISPRLFDSEVSKDELKQ
jgi:hypothetical protein